MNYKKIFGVSSKIVCAIKRNRKVWSSSFFILFMFFVTIFCRPVKAAADTIKVGYVGAGENIGNNEIEIDGIGYTFANGVYTAQVANDLGNIVLGLADNRVIYALSSNNTITKFACLKNVIEPYIEISSNPLGFIYSQGEYDYDSINMEIAVKCRRIGGSNNPFSQAELEKLDGIQFVMKELGIELDSDCLKLGNVGQQIWIKLSNIQNKTWDISLNKSQTVEYPIHIKQGYIPDVPNKSVTVSAQFKDDRGNAVACIPGTITIANIDLQRQLKQQQKSQGSLGQNFNALNSSLKGKPLAILNDAYLRQYISAKQCDEIEQFITLYLAELVVADKTKTGTYFEQFSNTVKEKVSNAIFSKLGVNSKKSWVLATDRKFDFIVHAVSNNGGLVEISFSGNLQIYDYDSKTFAGFGQIDFQATGDIPSDMPSSGIGQFSYYDLDAFSEILINYLKSAYKTTWGDNADQIAEMFVCDPISKFLSGTKFSDRIFDTSVKLAKGDDLKDIVLNDAAKDAKKYFKGLIKEKTTSVISVRCPVDIYIYDEAGLCGKIINDVIDPGYSEVIMLTEGDKKYICLTEDENYSIKIVARENGAMDYDRFEFENGELSRAIYNENISLRSGDEFTGNLTGLHSANEKVHTLYKGEDNEICTTYDSEIGDVEELFDYSISMRSVCITGYKGNDPYVIIPRTINRYPVTEISGTAFSGLDNIKYIEIPDSVRSIGSYAFRGCSNLSNIIIPEGITFIGWSAFFGCSSITDILIPEGLMTIENQTFCGCSSLKSVVIPDSVSSIGYSAFAGCASLENIIVPEKVTSIESSVFNGCSSLVGIGIPDGLVSIKGHAFEGCASLINIVIPESVTDIGEGAFHGCRSLLNVVST